jgi:hypothetical protein
MIAHFLLITLRGGLMKKYLIYISVLSLSLFLFLTLYAQTSTQRSIKIIKRQPQVMEEGQPQAQQEALSIPTRTLHIHCVRQVYDKIGYAPTSRHRAIVGVWRFKEGCSGGRDLDAGPVSSPHMYLDCGKGKVASFELAEGVCYLVSGYAGEEGSGNFDRPRGLEYTVMDVRKIRDQQLYLIFDFRQ